MSNLPDLAAKCAEDIGAIFDTKPIEITDSDIAETLPLAICLLARKRFEKH